MKLKDLYVTCDHVDWFGDVVVHDGGAKKNLTEYTNIEEMLERTVFAFRVVNGDTLHAYLEKEGE